MKNWVFRVAWMVTCLAQAVLVSYFMVKGFLTSKDLTSFFVSFCFFFALLPLLFIAYLIAMSFKKGTYFLPDLFFERDGSFNKIPFIAFGVLSLLTGSLVVFFGLSLLGVNPYTTSLTRIQVELIFATSGLLFSTFFFSFVFGLIHRGDGSLKELI